jgi:hypothetical protein
MELSVKSRQVELFAWKYTVTTRTAMTGSLPWAVQQNGCLLPT